MSESLTTYVRGVSAPGPKAKAVSLGIHEGVALWTWMAADAIVAPGMTFSCESVSFGKVQTSYTDAKGAEVALKVPKRQVFLYAKAVLDAPEQEAVVTDVEVTDAAREYAERFAKAQARTEDTDQDDDDAPW